MRWTGAASMRDTTTRLGQRLVDPSLAITARDFAQDDTSEENQLLTFHLYVDSPIRADKDFTLNRFVAGIPLKFKNLVAFRQPFVFYSEYCLTGPPLFARFIPPGVAQVFCFISCQKFDC